MGNHVKNEELHEFFKIPFRSFSHFPFFFSFSTRGKSSNSVSATFCARGAVVSRMREACVCGAYNLFTCVCGKCLF